MQNIDFEKKFSSTLRLESFRMLLVFAVHFDYEIKQMNVPNAYFKKNLKKIIYMKIFENHVISNSSKSNQSNKKTKNQILRFLRSFYEFKQSGRKWNFKTKNHLRIIGFKSINSNNCVFFDQSRRIILILYVDDLLIFSQSAKNINTMKNELFQKFSMKNIKKIIFILDIRIKRDINKKLIAIDQIIYIKKFLHEYEMKKTHAMIILIDDYQSLTSSDAIKAHIDQRKYQKQIDSFMYAMIVIRPDIIFVIKKLNQFCQNSAIRHRNVLNRIFRYLKKTTDLVLLFDQTTDSISYADAIYENDLIDRKFTYENTLFIKNDAVIWISKKQRIIVSSIIEAEYISMCQISKNIV